MVWGQYSSSYSVFAPVFFFSQRLSRLLSGGRRTDLTQQLVCWKKVILSSGCVKVGTFSC